MQRRDRPLARPRPIALAAALGLTLGAAVMPLAAHAQAATALPASEDVRVFDVPAGPLRPALDRFARTAGVDLRYDAALVESARTQGVAGSHGIAAALRALLSGSGLEAAAQPGGGYVLRRVAAAAPVPATAGREAALAEVKVTASALRDGTTEGTGSYTTGSTTAATGLNLSLRETPQSVTVITRDRMDEAGISSLGEALASTPGIVYQPGGTALGGYTFLYSRGYSVSSTILDGLPIPTAAFGGWADIQGLSTLNTDVYDSITVVRGATGLMTGAGDPSASIGLTRKRPTPEFQAHVSQSVGSWSQTHTVADVGGPLNAAGTLRGRLVGAYEQGKDWHEGYKYNKTVGYGVLEADLSSRTLATLALELGSNDAKGAAPYTGHALADTDGNPTPFGRSTNASADWTGFNDRRIGLTAALEHRFNDDWKVKAAYMRNDIQAKQRFGLTAGDIAPNGDTELHLRSYRAKNQADALSVKLDGKYELFGRKHDVVVGVNGAWSDEATPDWHMDFDTIVNVFTWNRKTPEPNWASLYEYGWRTKVEQIGLYAATRLRATDRLSVLGGARWSNWRSRDLDEAGGVTEDRKENGVFTPYLGVVYDLTPNLSAYASYTTIFNPQSSRDVNGSLLDPEEGSNVEAGIKGEWFGGRLNASAAVFRIKKDNLAVLDGGNLTPTGDDAYRAEDNTKGRGWELEVAGEPYPGWRVQGGYTHVVTKDSSGGRLNADQPKHQFKLYTSWTPASLNRLTVGGGVTWESSAYTDWVDDSWRSLYTQKSYAVVNLMARYAFSKKLTLTVNLNNVFDKVYRTEVSGHNYGAPRNLQANLRYQF